MPQIKKSLHAELPGVAHEVAHDVACLTVNSSLGSSIIVFFLSYT